MAGQDSNIYVARAAVRRRNRRRKQISRIVISIVIVAFIGLGAYFATSSGIFGSSNNNDSADVKNDVDSMSAPHEDEKETVGSIVMGVNGSETTIVKQGEEYLEAGAHAASETQVLTGKIQTSGSVDTNTPGTYEIKYSVEDGEGHKSSCTRKVVVKEDFDTMKSGVPVLMYHYVYTAADPPDEVNGNWILDTDLEAQLAYLKQNDFYFPSFQEIRAFIEGKHSLPARSVALTFDDAMDRFLAYGIPVLEKYQVPATSFVICSDGDATQKIVDYRNRYISFDSHSYALHQAGGNIGHGGRISALTKDQIVEDLKMSASITQCHSAFAYPFGDTTEDGKVAVEEAGYQCGFTTVNDWCYVGDDVRALNRVRIQGTAPLQTFIALVSED